MCDKPPVKFQKTANKYIFVAVTIKNTKMKYLLSAILLLVSFTSSFAQKKSITIDDFASWKRIQNQQVSNNGKFISYELNEQKGNGKLIIYSVENKTNVTITYAYDAKFSPNNDFLIYKIKPSADTVRKAKLAEVKKEKMFTRL